MGRGVDGPGAAALHLVDGVALLRSEHQVFAAMLARWRVQQLARNLADAFLGAWRSQMLDT